MGDDAGLKHAPHFSGFISRAQDMTTKITMLRNPAAVYGCSLKEGETGDVEEPLARVLVERSIAVVVDMPKEIKAVPEPPSIAGVEPEKTAVESGTEQPRKRR